MKRLLTYSLAFAALTSVSLAQDEGNVGLGKSLAEANCSECHNVQPGGAMKLFPPSFAAIAVYMHPDIIPIRIMYPDEHTNMPQWHKYMSTTNIRALTAYIRSLEGSTPTR